MDWGATIVFVLSIIGAVILSGGDVMVGIIAFLVIFCILAAIKGVVKFIASDDGDTDKRKPSVSTNTNAKTHIVFGEEHFEHTLNMVMKFLHAYSVERPNNWYHFFLSQVADREDSGTYGYIKFHVQLDSWSNGTLYKDPELEDFMNTIFTFDPQENIFTYNMLVGSSSSYAFPWDEVLKILHKYLDNYEAKHPGVRFERHDWGAKYSNL